MKKNTKIQKPAKKAVGKKTKVSAKPAPKPAPTPLKKKAVKKVGEPRRSAPPDLPKRLQVKEAKADTFPLVSVLDSDDMTRVIEILQDDAQMAAEISGMEDARKSMKAELVEIYERSGVKEGGLRWGPFVAYIRGMKTRRSLSADRVKEAWVEAGMDPEAIDGFYVESKPFADVRIVDTSAVKERSGSGDGREE